MEKFYCLYTDSSQGQLLACANDIDGVIATSKFYSDGCWFEYDMEGNNLYNEREYGYDQFPEVPEDRHKAKIEADDRVTFSKVGF
jgi:hypothetical protein